MTMKEVREDESREDPTLLLLEARRDGGNDKAQAHSPALRTRWEYAQQEVDAPGLREAGAETLAAARTPARRHEIQVSELSIEP